MSRASDLAYETIRAKILSGELAPMTQLKEEELAEMCGVSRTPIRDALRRLEADMLVRRTDTQRTFVPDWSPEEVEEIFTLRMLLESHAAGRAARFVTAEEIETLRSYTDLIRDAIEKPDFDSLTFVENNRLFHNLILSIAKSDRLAKIRGMIVEQGILHSTARIMTGLGCAAAIPTMKNCSWRSKRVTKRGPVRSWRAISFAPIM